jgi:hypothetical protein
MAIGAWLTGNIDTPLTFLFFVIAVLLLIGMFIADHPVHRRGGGLPGSDHPGSADLAGAFRIWFIADGSRRCSMA